VCICEYMCDNTTLNSTLYVTQNPQTRTNLFTLFKDLQVVLCLLSRLIGTILSFVTKKNAGAGGIMPLENPLGLHLHHKGSEDGKQWVIRSQSPAACLAFKFLANVHVRVFEQSCKSLSVHHTSCVFRMHWDFFRLPLLVPRICYCENSKPYLKDSYSDSMQILHSIIHKL